mmetsp:Transcript_24595/g.21775  ORF Transcript_24595/g.21775 Transcript_24595/m.21775 type:complete len:130 (-) Transcript_24595:348-737(-)
MKADSGWKYRGRFLRVERAPEPSDVYWLNAGISTREKMGRRAKSNFVLALIMVLIFAAISGINTLKLNRERDGNDVNELYVRLLTTGGSFAITMLNYLLKVIIIRLAKYEKYSTYTSFERSYSQKLSIA